MSTSLKNPSAFMSSRVLTDADMRALFLKSGSLGNDLPVLPLLSVSITTSESSGLSNSLVGADGWRIVRPFASELYSSSGTSIPVSRDIVI